MGLRPKGAEDFENAFASSHAVEPIVDQGEAVAGKGGGGGAVVAVVGILSEYRRVSRARQSVFLDARGGRGGVRFLRRRFFS